VKEMWQAAQRWGSRRILLLTGASVDRPRPLAGAAAMGQPLFRPRPHVAGNPRKGVLAGGHGSQLSTI
jgi:hypothetical protein